MPTGPEKKQQCCTKGKCCQNLLAERSVQDVLGVLRSALSVAVAEGLVSKNVAAALRLTKPRKKRIKPWSG